MRKETENWWRQAETDFRTANNSFNSKDYYACAFWCQQAVEKAFKAVLIKKKAIMPKVHDLVFLARKLNLSDEQLKKCDKLTHVYTETRYPDMAGGPPSKKFTQEKAEGYMEIAEEMMEWAKNQI